MEQKKNLSSARKKLEEYKMSKGVSSGTTFTNVNERGGVLGVSVVDNRAAYQETSLPLPPPVQPFPTYLNNLSQELQMTEKGEAKVLNVMQSDNDTTITTSPPQSVGDNGLFEVSTFSKAVVPNPFDQEMHNLPTPTAPSLEGNQYQFHSAFTESAQNPTVNFFQSTPITHDHHSQNDKSFYQQQDFYYQQPQPSMPLFYNVDNSVAPLQSFPTFQNNENSLSPVSKDEKHTEKLIHEDPFAKLIPSNILSQPSLVSSTPEQPDELTTPVFQNNGPNFRDSPFEHPFDETSQQMTTPNLRRISTPSQEEKEKLEMQNLQRMKSIQDALELQLEEKRLENDRLMERQAELISQIEDNEKMIQDIRKERDRSKEEARKELQPLNIKINNLYEENQRILKNSNNVGMELRSKLQEKTKQHEEMEQAFIIVSKSKMDLAAELDQEREKTKELEANVSAKDKEIIEMRNTVNKLEDKLKVEQQKDAVIHQLEDQIRHFRVQSETLQRELRRANNKIERLYLTNSSKMQHAENCSEFVGTAPLLDNNNQIQSHHEHEHEGICDHSTHDHNHEDHSTHDHNHDDHSTHDHNHENHAEEHDDHEHIHYPQTTEISEMEKRLAHLEWQNSTFRSDIDTLSSEAREKRVFEEKFIKVAEECEKLQNECKRLELLVVQLQGENDTIGDYIALYQSQRLALKESAREKDVQLENLSKERETLVRKLEELTHLIRSIKRPQTAQDANAQDPLQQQCPHGYLQENSNNSPNNEIEGQIRNLLSEINSSPFVIENFHPCAVCSGQLMNV